MNNLVSQEGLTDCSKSCSRALALYLATLGIGSTSLANLTDRQIVVEGSALLPIVNSMVDIDLFLWVLPLLLLALFVIFHMQFYTLHRLHVNATSSSASRLAVEYTTLFLMLFDRDRPLSRIERAVFLFAVWLSLPVFIVCHAFAAIRLHETIHSYGLLVLACVGIILCLLFRYRVTNLHRRSTKLTRKLRTITIISIVAPVAILGGFVINKAHAGWPIYEWIEGPVFIGEAKSITEARIRSLFVLDAPNADLVSPRQDNQRVAYWRDFTGRHFEGANLSGADFRNAIFRNSQLTGADLRGANFSKSYFDKVDMKYVHMEYCDFTGATLSDVDASFSYIDNSLFDSSQIMLSKFIGGELTYISARNSSFRGSDFYDAEISGANLSNSEFASIAVNYYEDDKPRILSVPCRFHYATLRGTIATGTNFSYAYMASTDLTTAQFDSSRFFQTTLDSAVLMATSFRDCEISPQQLSKALTLYNAKLDSSVLESIRQGAPKLLEHPGQITLEGPGGKRTAIGATNLGSR